MNCTCASLISIEYLPAWIVRLPETNAKGTSPLSVIVLPNCAFAGTAIPTNKHETLTVSNTAFFIVELLLTVTGCFRRQLHSGGVGLAGFLVVHFARVFDEGSNASAPVDLPTGRRVSSEKHSIRYYKTQTRKTNIENRGDFRH